MDELEERAQNALLGLTSEFVTDELILPRAYGSTLAWARELPAANFSA